MQHTCALLLMYEVCNCDTGNWNQAAMACPAQENAVHMYCLSWKRAALFSVTNDNAVVASKQKARSATEQEEPGSVTPGCIWPVFLARIVHGMLCNLSPTHMLHRPKACVAGGRLSCRHALIIHSSLVQQLSYFQTQKADQHSANCTATIGDGHRLSATMPHAYRRPTLERLRSESAEHSAAIHSVFCCSW